MGYFPEAIDLTNDNNDTINAHDVSIKRNAVGNEEPESGEYATTCNQYHSIYDDIVTQLSPWLTQEKDNIINILYKLVTAKPLSFTSPHNSTSRITAIEGISRPCPDQFAYKHGIIDTYIQSRSDSITNINNDSNINHSDNNRNNGATNTNDMTTDILPPHILSYRWLSYTTCQYISQCLLTAYHLYTKLLSTTLPPSITSPKDKHLPHQHPYHNHHPHKQLSHHLLSQSSHPLPPSTPISKLLAIGPNSPVIALSSFTAINTGIPLTCIADSTLYDLPYEHVLSILSHPTSPTSSSPTTTSSSSPPNTPSSSLLPQSSSILIVCHSTIVEYLLNLLKQHSKHSNHSTILNTIIFLTTDTPTASSLPYPSPSPSLPLSQHHPNLPFVYTIVPFYHFLAIGSATLQYNQHNTSNADTPAPTSSPSPFSPTLASSPSSSPPPSTPATPPSSTPIPYTALTLYSSGSTGIPTPSYITDLSLRHVLAKPLSSIPPFIAVEVSLYHADTCIS